MKHSNQSVPPPPSAYHVELCKILMGQSTEALFVVDANNFCVNANPAACTALGRERGELIGHYLPDADLRSLLPHSQKHRLPDGYLLYRTHETTNANRDHEPDAVDLTRDHFTSVADQAPALLWLTDARGSCIYVSPRWLEFTGQSLQEAMGAGWLQAIHPKDRRRAYAIFANAFSTLEEFTIDCRVRQHNGRYRWAVTSARPIFDHDGSLQGFVGSVVDIHDHKQTEAYFRALIDASAQIVWAMDMDGNPLDDSTSWYDFTGQSIEDLKNMGWLDVIHPDDRAPVVEHFQQLPHTGSFQIDYRLWHVSGEWRWTTARVVPILDDEGQPQALVGMNIDITEKKQAQDALRMEQERLRQIAAAVPGMIFMVQQTEDGALRLSYTSRGIEDLYGLSAEETVEDASILLSLIHEEDRIRILQDLEDSVNLSRTQHNEFRIQHPQKGEIWAESHSIADFGPDGRSSWYGFIANITERKEMEEALRRSELFFTEIFRISPAALSISSLSDGTFIDVNSSFERLLGYSREELIGRTSTELNMFLHSTDRAEILQRFQRTGSISEEEIALRAKNGEIRNVLFSLEAVDTGNDPRLLIIALDITQRIQEEQATKEREARYRMLIEHAADSLFVNDTNGKLIEVNYAAHKLLGYTEAELLAMNVADLIAPDTLQKNPLQFKTLRENETMTTERVLVRKDGSTIHAEVHARKLPDGRIHALVRDTTRQKEAEQALRESEARYRILMEQAIDGVFISDLEGNYSDVNEAGCRLVGYSRAELLNMSALDLLTPQDREAFIQSRGHFIQGEVIQAEGELIRKDGTTVSVDISGKLLPDGRLYAIIRDITDRKVVQERLGLALSSARMGVWEWEIPEDKIYWSAECYEIFGVDEFEAQHQSFFDFVHPDDTAWVGQVFDDALKNQTIFEVELRIIRPDEEIRWISNVANIHHSTTGQALRVTGTVQDITERKKAEADQLQLEAQLQQAQKMESIGRLAGGVAHDFNNLLTVIQMYGDLMRKQMRKQMPEETALLKKLEHIRSASTRAAALTGQLLAFSRKQILAPTILDLNTLIENLHAMLERLIGEDIHFVYNLQPNLWKVTADPGQLEQVLMNLIVNARDAMPVGGTLTVQTRNVKIQAEDAGAYIDIPVGSNVMLSISDTGHGIDAETRQRIFEPFFTTKEPGKGTGLGLATVHGIIKQSGGGVIVESRQGQGTIFKIYLPASDRGESRAPARTDAMHSLHGSEMVLLVEDEESVRNLVKEVLQDAGYTVLEAKDALEALSLAQQYAGQFDLLLTDVVMPHMSGRELYDQLRLRSQQMSVLFMSGYTDDDVVRHGLLTAEVNFLPKPFSPDKLNAKVREVLDK